MIIDVYNSNDDIILTLDSESVDGPTFKDDTLHEYLETNASTFDFEIPRFLKSKPIDDVDKIDDSCRFGFDFNGTRYKFYSYSFTKNFTTIKIQCNNLSLEIMSEVNRRYLNDKQKTMAEYIQALLWEKGAKGTIGINEIADRKRTITFEDEGTKLSRLQTLASQFGAEVEIESKEDNTLVINIYDANTDEGRGRYRHDIVLTEDDMIDFEYISDKSELYNAVNFTGAKTEGDKETTFDLSNQVKEIKDSSGAIEFYTKKGDPQVYAPLSVTKYSRKMGNTDDWIVYQGATEYTTEADLSAYAFRFLKSHAYPVYTFTLTVAYTDKIQSLEIGDWVDLDVSAFWKTEGLWTIRVSEIDRRLSVPGTITITAKTVIRQSSEINGSLSKRMQEIAAAQAPYILTLITDSSLFFTDNLQIATISTMLSKGNKGIDSYSLKWYLDGDLVTENKLCSIKMSMLKKDTAMLVCEAYVDDELIAAERLSLAKVKNGMDGKLSYFYIAYADDADGSGFSLDPTGKLYIGTYSDFENVQSQAPGKYTWARFKGEEGALDEEQVKEMTDKINSKADAELTAEQINALNELAELARAELEAKATIDTVNSWIKALEDEISERKTGQESSEKALIEASNRLIAQQQTIADMKIQTDFVETYMSQSEEGLIIGRKDGTASVKVSNDRISFFSAGKETAFISQGVLQIENGIFTKKLQIGRYRVEQYAIDPDVNVIRYVGGVKFGDYSKI